MPIETGRKTRQIDARQNLSIEKKNLSIENKNLAIENRIILRIILRNIIR